MTVTLHQGEALRILQTLPDASVEAAQGLPVARQDGLFQPEPEAA